MSIVFQTDYLIYEISETGQNVRFTEINSGNNRSLPAPCAFITGNDRTVIPAVGAALEQDILSIRFADRTTAELQVLCNRTYMIFTLRAVSRTDFLSISFVNIPLREEPSSFCGCLMGLTLATHMLEHPGDNSILRASAYPHIGLFSTARSQYPAKAAVIGAPIENLRDIQKCVLTEIPAGEIPLSRKGGPYSDTVAKEAQGSYTVFSLTVNDDNIDDVIDSMKRHGITQITLHHYGHYTQGDFQFDKSLFPNGMADFKRIVDRLHKENFLVGIQPYAFFLVPNASYVSPVPHKDLDTLRTFTLKEDISATDTALWVMESTDGVTPVQEYVFVNSPYLWIDDELIRFRQVENGCFSPCERGAYGTVPAPHKANASVRQLKEYFMLPIARVNSELFYEIARNTARFYNECGADYMYLDALDGAFVLDGEDYVWYHAMDFIREMFRYLERDPIFDCCFNPAYTGSWYVRSRYGATDDSLLAHRECIDAHLNYNLKTSHRMGITPELGWVNLYPRYHDTNDLWQNEVYLPEDLEHLCSKAFATGASLAFLVTFHMYKSLPWAETYCKILQKYAAFREANKPAAATENYLKIPGHSALLENSQLIKAQHSTCIAEHCGDILTVKNDFHQQHASFHFQPRCAAGDYDDPNGITLLELPETEPVTTQCYRFDTPVDAGRNRGLGVWCCGDNSGAVICIGLRKTSRNSQKNSQHFIRLDFSGWRYFAFYEPQNGMLPTDLWPRKELIYTTYNSLQSYYHHYRLNFDYSTIEGVDITVTAPCNARLKSIRLVPHTTPAWVEPTIETACSSLTIHTTVPADSILSFDGKTCVITDNNGKILEKPAYTGSFVVPAGESTIRITHKGDNAIVRAKLTVTVRGEKLQ